MKTIEERARALAEENTTCRGCGYDTFVIEGRCLRDGCATCCYCGRDLSEKMNMNVNDSPNDPRCPDCNVPVHRCSCPRYAMPSPKELRESAKLISVHAEWCEARALHERENGAVGQQSPPLSRPPGEKTTEQNNMDSEVETALGELTHALREAAGYGSLVSVTVSKAAFEQFMELLPLPELGRKVVQARGRMAYQTQDGLIDIVREEEQHG